MSIAALSSSFVAAVRERIAPLASQTVAAADQAPPAREGGLRHALVDAMKLALGSEATSERGDDQDVFRFAQALMHDLRRIEGSEDADGPGRGKAWGRRDWNDLPQRIDALATVISASAQAQDVDEKAAPAPEVPGTPAVLPELSPQPNLVTATSAAVHLMQVPSSRLLEAYAALHQALGAGATAPSASDARSALAELLGRMSQSLAADTTAALPAGGVVNLRA